MAMTEVGIRLSLEGGKIVAANIDGVAYSLGKLDTGARQAASGTETLKTAMAGLVTVGAATALIKMADAATTLQTQLRLSSNSVAEAKNAYGALFTIAQQGRVSFTELGNTYASIARAGKELGVSQTRLLDVTKSISQAMTIGGGSAASMQAALVQLGQGLSSGVLRGEELNSIMEQTPRLAKAIADGLGVPIGKLRELGAAGELTSQQVISALEKAGPALAKEMESATLTVGQAFTMLGNSTVKFVGDADKASGASSALATTLKDVVGAIDTVGSAINNNQVAFAALAGGLGGTAAVAGLASVAANIGKIRVAFVALSAVMAANPVTLTLMGIGAAVGGAYAMIEAKSKTLESMKAELAKLESSTGTSIYGIKSSDAAMQKNMENITRLRGAIAELEAASNKYGNAEDARLAAGTEAYKQRKATMEAFEKAGSAYLSRDEKNQATLAKEIATAQAAMANGSITADQYAKRINDVQASFAKHASGAKKLSDEQKLVNAGLALYNDLMASENGYNADFNEKVRALAAHYQATAQSAEEYAHALDLLLQKQSGFKALADAEQKEATEAAKRWGAGYAKQIAEEEKAYRKLADAIDDVDKSINALLRENDAMQAGIELELSLMGQTAEARDKAIAQQQVLNKYIKEENEARLTIANPAVLQSKLEMIDTQKLRALDLAAQKQSIADWNKTYDRIEDGLVDALMKGGKEGAQGVRDLLVDALVSEPFEIVVRALLQPIAQGLTSMVTGRNADGTASSGGSLLNLGGGLSSMGWGDSIALGLENTGIKLLEGGYNQLGESALSLSQTVDSFAETLNIAGSAFSYLNAINLAGEGKWGAAIGTAAGEALGGPVGAFIGNTIGSFADDLFGGGGGPKTDSSYGDLGVNGYAGLGDTSKTGGAGQYATAIEDSWGNLKESLDLTSDLIAGAYYSIDAAGDDITFFNARGTLDGEVVSDRFDRMGGVREAGVGRSEEELQAAMENEMTRILFNALKASDIGEQAKTYLSEVTASLPDMVNEADQLDAMTTAMLNVVVIHDFQAALENLPFEYLADLSFNAAKGLIEAAGGLSALDANLKGYYANFYSESEKTALLTTNTAKAFTDLGLVMPEVGDGMKDAYRAEVERLGAMDLGIEANAKAYAGALALQGGVDSLADTFDKAAASTNEAWASILDARGQNGDAFSTQIAIDSAYASVQAADPSVTMDKIINVSEQVFRSLTAEQQGYFSSIIVGTAKLGETLKGFADESSQLSVELLTAQGDTAGAAEALRDLETKGLNAAEIAAYDYNQALRDQISAYDKLTSIQDKYKTLTLDDAADQIADVLGTSVAESFKTASSDKIKSEILDYAAKLDPLTASGQSAIEQLDKLSPALDMFVTAADDAAKATEELSTSVSDQLGFDAAGLAAMITEAARNTGDAANSFAVALSTSVKNAMLNTAVGEIASTIYSSIITPIIAGAAVSQATTDSVMADARSKLSGLKSMFESVEFGELLDSITNAVSPTLAPIQDLSTASNQAATSITNLSNSLSNIGNEFRDNGLSSIGTDFSGYSSGFDYFGARDYQFSDMQAGFAAYIDDQLQMARTYAGRRLIPNKSATGPDDRLISAGDMDYASILKANLDDLGFNGAIQGLLDSFGQKLSVFSTNANELKIRLAQANDTVVGNNLNLQTVADSFLDLAKTLSTAQGNYQTVIDAITTTGLNPDDFDLINLGQTSTLISDAANLVGATIIDAMAAAIPEAIKTNTTLEGLDVEYQSVLSGVMSGDVQSLGDAYTILTGAMAGGEITAAQYKESIDYITNAFKTSAESVTEVVDTLKQWQDKLAALQDPTGAVSRAQALAADLATTTDAATQAVIRQVYALEDADTAVTNALSGVRRAIDARKQAIQDDADAQVKVLQDSIDANQEAVDAASKSVDTLTGIFDSITSAVKTLRGSVNEEANLLSARAYIDMSLSLAKAGVMPDATKLQDAMSVVTQDTADMYASQSDYVYAQLVQAGKLEELGAIVGTQKTRDQQQLDALTDGNKYASDQIKAIQDAAESQIDVLDDQLKAAQDAVDVMRGVDISVLSVADAVDRLALALAAEKTSTTALLQQNIESAKTSARDSAIASAVSPGNYDYGYSYTDPKTGVTYGGSGSSTADPLRTSAVLDAANVRAVAAAPDATYAAVATAIKNGTWTASGPGDLSYEALIHDPRFNSYAIGTNYIPSDQLAYLHEGEAVVPKAYNPAAGGSGNARLESLVEGLTKEVQRLQAIVNDGNKHAARTADATNGRPEQPMLVETV